GDDLATEDDRKAERGMKPFAGGHLRARKRLAGEVRNPERSAAAPDDSGEADPRAEGGLAAYGSELGRRQVGRAPLGDAVQLGRLLVDVRVAPLPVDGDESVADALEDVLVPFALRLGVLARSLLEDQKPLGPLDRPPAGLVEDADEEGHAEEEPEAGQVLGG